MATPTFDELTTIPTQEEAHEQDVLPELRRRRVRVDDWLVGGVYRAMAQLVARLWVIARTEIAALTAAGFEEYVFGFATPPSGIDVTPWATLVAKNRYNVTRIAATYTRRTVTLTNATNTAYGPLQPGAIILRFSSGNRYVLDQVVTIPANGGGGTASITATFRSEFTTDSATGRIYNDPSNDTITFVTSRYPGVTATNPSTTYSAVSQIGSGTGTLTLTGAPTGNHSVAVRIDGTGQSGAATWSTSLDGAGWSPQGAVGSVPNLGGIAGLNIALTNGSSNPSFIAGTYYYFSLPGSDIIQVGRDLETPQELGARCRALWPMLAFPSDGQGNWIPASPTMAAYEALTRSASTQVKVALVQTNGRINNRVDVVIAGQGSTLPSSVIATVQAFFLHFTMLTDDARVLSPTPTTITLGGLTITVRSGQLTTAKAAVKKALQTYYGGGDTAALSINGRIDHAHLVHLLRSAAGVKKVTDTTLTINGAVGDLQLPTVGGQYQLASWTQDSDTAFTWVEE